MENGAHIETRVEESYCVYYQGAYVSTFNSKEDAERCLELCKQLDKCESAYHTAKQELSEFKHQRAALKPRLQYEKTKGEPQ